MNLRKTQNLWNISTNSIPHEDTDLFCITEYKKLVSHEAKMIHQNILPAGMNYLKQTEYLKSRIT